MNFLIQIRGLRPPFIHIVSTLKVNHILDKKKFQVAFDQIGFMTTTTISRQRKKQEPAVMAELDQRLRRLNSINASDEQ